MIWDQPMGVMTWSYSHGIVFDYPMGMIMVTLKVSHGHSHWVELSTIPLYRYGVFGGI
jgi:hypothetical protein